MNDEEIKAEFLKSHRKAKIIFEEIKSAIYEVCLTFPEAEINLPEHIQINGLYFYF